MNEMYNYLQEHNYISKNKNKNPLRQQELSKERAECIANKYDNLIKELQKENQELKKQLEKEEHLVDKAIRVSLKQKSTIENYKYKIDVLKIKQKEFIKLLETELQDDRSEDDLWLMGYYDACRDIYEKYIGKYKEIIGEK